jgi:hypothetical protein
MSACRAAATWLAWGLDFFGAPRRCATPRPRFVACPRVPGAAAVAEPSKWRLLGAPRPRGYERVVQHMRHVSASGRESGVRGSGVPRCLTRPLPTSPVLSGRAALVTESRDVEMDRRAPPCPRTRGIVRGSTWTCQLLQNLTWWCLYGQWWCVSLWPDMASG